MNSWIDRIASWYEGRIDRITCFQLSVFPTIVFLILMVSFGFITAKAGLPKSVIYLIVFLMGAGLGVFMLSVYVRRLHDMGLSGWWCLLTYVPYLGVLFYLWLLIWPGESFQNKFGPPPED